MAIGFGNTGAESMGAPLEETSALPVRAMTREEAHTVVERAKNVLAKQKVIRGNAETIDQPKLADPDVLRRQTWNTLNNRD